MLYFELNIFSCLVCFSLSGKGECDGATVELALNYVADLTAKKQGGMFRITDVPYSSSTETWVTCDDVTSGKVPAVGIQGWTKLPSNDYKATMNAVAKVHSSFGGGHFLMNRISFLFSYKIFMPSFLLRHLFQVGPLAIAVSAGGWGSYEKGIFENKGVDNENDNAVVNHAVLLVGYGFDEATGEKYYKIRNSWGPKFGEGGEFVLIIRATMFSVFCLNAS
jgi:hypothetical protein